MEKSRVAQRQQQFAEQLEPLERELQELQAARNAADSTTRRGTEPVDAAASDSAQPSNTASCPHVSVEMLEQRIVRTLYRIAELCGRYQDYKLAALYYNRVLEWLEARETARREASLLRAAPPLARAKSKALAESRRSVLTDNNNNNSSNSNNDNSCASGSSSSRLTDTEVQLKHNVLNNLAVMHFGAGDRAQAMTCLLDAKKHVRERLATEQALGTAQDGDNVGPLESTHSDRASSHDLESVLTANYALFLHANGHIDDAIHTASAVIEAESLTRHDGAVSVDGVRAKVTALSLLASCWKAKGEDEQAMEFASQAAQLAEQGYDAGLVARAFNNLAMYCFERRELSTALRHLLTAYKATQSAQDLEQQAVVKYHIGLVIAELEESVELPQSSRAENIHRVTALGQAPSATTATSDSDAIAELKELSRSVSKRTALTGAAPLEAAASATSATDCFVQSENLANALPGQDVGLSLLAHGCQGEDKYYAGEFHTAEAEFSIALKRLREHLPLSTGDDSVSAPRRSHAQAKTSRAAELVKIQGHLLSFLGCTQLVEGKFDLAEESHQSDLDLALQHEDIHAQQRALRNLALVYSSTQRYHEAIPLWREALEISSVLQCKLDQMMAYSGLGTAMKELRITDQKGEFAELLSKRENDPLQIFLRQRALAMELGDKSQHIIAQRNIVSTYESSARPDIEQRLAECDTLVRLCEQYENLQYRTDAYRALANALTAQLARLNARGARFAEAINVLTQKRNSVCAKYQQTTRTLKTVTAAMLRADEREANMFAFKKTSQPDDRHARPRLVRMEFLQRR